MSKIDRIPLLSSFNAILIDSKRWIPYAIVLILPLRAIIIVIIILFGQTPHDIIKAFTETSEWTFSTKISPQNITYDEHYLCTVAAGGHKNVVKPLRKGVRHGHQVTVNRQLLIENSFEQLLEENASSLHIVDIHPEDRIAIQYTGKSLKDFRNNKKVC